MRQEVFLNMFLRLGGFWGSFSYKNFLIKKKQKTFNLKNTAAPPQDNLNDTSNSMYCQCKIQFNDLWFVFYDSSWSFHEPDFNRKHIFYKSFRVNRTQNYDLKTCRQVPNYLVMSKCQHSFQKILTWNKSLVNINFLWNQNKKLKRWQTLF